MNCEASKGWQQLRRELRELLWLPLEEQNDSALQWLRRLGRSRESLLEDCGIGRLSLVVAELLLCILAGSPHGCVKHWAHAAKAGHALKRSQMT